MLVLEVLALNIRSNPCITGLSIPGSQAPLSLISQYADDTSLIVDSDDAILAVFDTYSRFEAASGAKLNVFKSKGLLLGAWSNRRDPPVQLEWTSENIKVLGVYVGPGDLEEANWRPRITAVENVLASGSNRSVKVTDHFSCISTNVIYCITCTLCKKIYIGKTRRRQAGRFREQDYKPNRLRFL